jgi:hypothetical protein
VLDRAVEFFAVLQRVHPNAVVEFLL